MDEPFEEDVFADRTEAAPKGMILVPLAGAGTTALTLLVSWWLARNFDEFNVMGWYAAGIFPIGAFLVGMGAGSGYCLASWLRGVKISGLLLWLVVTMQIMAYGAAQYLEYVEAEPRFRNGQPMGFVEYFDVVTRSFQFRKAGHGGQNNNPGGTMGAWGYLFRVLELGGFALGGVLAPVLLMSTPYCDPCRMYMRTRQMALIPAGLSPKELKKAPGQTPLEMINAAYAKMKDFVQVATNEDAAEFTTLCRQYPSKPSGMKKLGKVIKVELSKCPNCHAGFLKGTLLTLNDEKAQPIEISRVPLTPEFTQQVQTSA